MASENKGIYSEKLKTGGEIQVWSASWNIRYYFPGPDARYNGTWVTLGGNDIDEYINAWKSNFLKYEKLKEAMPKEGSSQFPGDMNMTVRIGGYGDGVCLRGYHMAIRTKEKLDAVITDYEYAKKRAQILMETLSNL